jgi:uncharacterized protein (DUF433 family)
LELLAHGASWDEILADYSFLEREDIQACLDFAAAQSDHALIKGVVKSWSTTNYHVLW